MFVTFDNQFNEVNQFLGTIVEFAAQHRLPAIYHFREQIAAGGLIAYGPSLNENNRLAAAMADKILRGARPSDLPIEQPTVFDLIVNRTAATDLVVTVPPDLAAPVTEWIGAP